jgi:hypothetical protein
MAKIPKTFRLSEQAVKNLEQIVNQTGSSDTAIVEMALAHFAKVMQGQVKVNQVPVKSVPEELPPDFWEEKEAPKVSSNLSSARGDKKKYKHH